MEKRLDEGLAFILQYKNIAWYEDGVVRILDRRIYPIETKFVECRSHQQVAQAIKDMVTQSWGPYFAAGMGMVLACHEARDLGEMEFIDYIHKAGISLYSARPTTSALMKKIVENCEASALGAKAAGRDALDAAFNTAVSYYDEVYTQTGKMGSFLAEKFPQQGTVMTQCWAETVVGMTLKEIRRTNKEIKFFCPETRPYFQGARLTASCIRDMDFDVTVITDNMPGYVLKKKNVDVFTSAADVICMDGTVVNKVGTFQIALCSDYYDIPYYATGIPDVAHPGRESVTIEERDPELTMYALDVKTTMDGVKGYYPAFDFTPPELVTGIITDKGCYTPNKVKEYYND
jgi:methylthioribose-1-phosphate isomerase